MNCGIETLSILVCIILLIHQFTIKTRRETDKWFRTALVANIMMLLGDMADWLLSGSNWGGAEYVLTYAMAVYFAASGVLMFSFFSYIYLYLKQKIDLPEFMIKIAAFMMILQIFFAVVSPFTGAIYRINDQNIYERGPVFALSQITAVITFGMAFWIFISRWKAIGKKERIYFTMYLLAPTLSEFVQVKFYGVAALNVAVTLSFLLVNLFVTAELDEQVRMADQKMEFERMTALKKQQSIQSKILAQTILALSSAVEAKDRYTNGHSIRVAAYAKEIVRRMGWNEDEQQKVYYAGLLHDVGKIRIADAIINKNGKLTNEEYEEIKLHTLSGYYILKEISMISDFAIAARWHHERFDGSGYPNGLYGNNIPLLARIIGVADAYDAMTSNRSYRGAMPQERVKEEIEKGMGTQFDPRIAEIMLQMIAEDTAYKMREPENMAERVILAIDDDAMVLKFVEFFLKSINGYRLITASSGKEGIEIMRRVGVDLVLLDVEMPGMTGIDVLTWIREEQETLPVIFMTGDRDMVVIQKAEKLGVNDYLTKPIIPRMLKESMENVFQSRRNTL